jgi:hypothetical protein
MKIVEAKRRPARWYQRTGQVFIGTFETVALQTTEPRGKPLHICGSNKSGTIATPAGTISRSSFASTRGTSASMARTMAGNYAMG